MKNITTALFALGLFTAPNSTALADDTELVLTVSSINDHQGTLMVAVFDNEADWNGGSPVAGARIDVTSDTASASLGLLPQGEYAIRLFHDVNGNGELDTNLMGIPSEPFAFSNNARGSFGPASWADAAFELSADSGAHAVRLD